MEGLMGHGGVMAKAETEKLLLQAKDNIYLLP